jgi:HTH-type transcriptional regulator / antitoxin HigA
MDIKPIKGDEDYRATLREIESLMRAAPDTSEGERLDVLVTLVEAYERQHYPLDFQPARDTPAAAGACWSDARRARAL